MEYFWNDEKNEILKQTRDISFEEIVEYLQSNELLGSVDNPSKNYPNQKAFLINIKNYIYLVPFVEDKEGVFLKTIIPSRKATKQYLR
jgi:uncharacterized DUF497 family protein